MNNVFNNQDIRGIILSKKKQLIDEEVLLELLLNESHFRYKIMLAELKKTIEEIKRLKKLCVMSSVINMKILTALQPLLMKMIVN